MRLYPQQFGAKGDGQHDDLPALRQAFAAATTGDVIELGRVHALYARDGGTGPLLSLPADVSLEGEQSVLVGYEAQGAALRSRDVLGIGAACTMPVRISGVRVIYGSTAVRVMPTAVLIRGSRFVDCVIAPAEECGVRIEPGAVAIGVEMERVQITGGAIGLHVETSTSVNTAIFRQLRVSNTYGVAMRVSNPSPSTVHTLAMYECAIEGNRGGGISLAGGFAVRLYGGHFEKNGRDSGEADIVLGATGSAICSVSLDGTAFSAPSAAQQSRRIRWSGPRGRIVAVAPRWNAADVLEVGPHGIGSRVDLIAAPVAPTIVGAVTVGSAP